MYKGKYVLLSINELKEKLSNYLDVRFNLVLGEQLEGIDTKELNSLCIEIPNVNLTTKNVIEFMSEIIGLNEHEISDLTFDFEHGNKLCLDITQCSFMLKKVLEIQEEVVFDDESLLVNDGKDIYLFYTNKKIIDYEKQKIENQVAEFFSDLLKMYKDEKLNVNSIVEMIEGAPFSSQIKIDLQSRVTAHKHCEFDDDENVFPLVVAIYGDNENISLECEGCYSVVIDDEILSNMVSQ